MNALTLSTRTDRLITIRAHDNPIFVRSASASQDLARQIRTRLNRNSLLQGPYRDNDNSNLECIASELSRRTPDKLRRLLQVKKLFSRDAPLLPTGPLEVEYMLDCFRTVSGNLNAGEIMDTAKVNLPDGGYKLVITAEEAYVLAVAVLRRMGMDAYPVYLLDGWTQKQALALLISDSNDNAPITFVRLSEQRVDFVNFTILGDRAVTAMLYAMAAENCVKHVDIMIMGGVYKDPKVISYVLNSAEMLVRIAREIDPNCIKANEVDRLIGMLGDSIKIAKHGSAIPITN